MRVDMHSNIELIKEIIERVPKSPGVYLMKGENSQILYIGKAKNLWQRVRTYFYKNGDDRLFVSKLEYLVFDIETIVTRNEKEALLLENNLIKEHRPRFNVRLTDDKNYLSIRLNTKVSFPRLEVVRKIVNDGARYFGPYQMALACRETLDVVNRHFRLRTCTDQVMRNRSRPCLQYQIKRCDAPCVYPISRQVYDEQVNDVILFLEGKNKELLQTLKHRLAQAVQKLEFEIAASLRDQIQSLERALETQQVVSSRLINQDVLGFYREGSSVEIVVLSVRRGKLSGRKSYLFKEQEVEDAEVLSSFLSQYYEINAIPEELLLPFDIEDSELKEGWLKEKKIQRAILATEKKFRLLVPQKGSMRQLVNLANQNAQSSYQSHRPNQHDTKTLLEKIQHKLSLSKTPWHIECVDISHFQGKLVVAGFVTFVDGVKKPSLYKMFRLKTDKNDDFLAIYEVVSRRVRRSIKGDWPLPDLLLIDGGKGQLQSALLAIQEQGLSIKDIPLISIAKERENISSELQKDRIFIPHVKDPIVLRQNAPELFLLSKIRDEAHRFSLYHQKKQRSSAFIKTALDDITGLGIQRKKKLLATFGSVSEIAKASFEDINRVVRNSTLAALIKKSLI